VVRKVKFRGVMIWCDMCAIVNVTTEKNTYIYIEKRLSKPDLFIQNYES